MRNVLYTQSPGGIRRGLIWQSSKTSEIEYDPRNFLFVPHGSTQNLYLWEGNTSYYTIYNGLIGNTNNLQQIRPVIDDAQKVLLSCPYYPYSTEVGTDPDGDPYITSVGDEHSYQYEIDMIISPALQKTSRSTSYLEEPYYNELASGQKNWTGVQELNPDSTVNNLGLLGTQTGECLDVDVLSNVNTILNATRHSAISAPCRIKGTFIYSDYPFALSNSITGGYENAKIIEFPNDLCTDYFIGILNNIQMPDISNFVGASTRTEHGGNLYDDWNMNVFNNASAQSYRKDSHDSTSDAVKHYRYNQGTMIDSPGGDFQLYFGPSVFPAVSFTSGYTATSNMFDGQIYLPNAASNISITNFTKHASPGFIGPFITTPYIILSDGTNNTATWGKKYIEYTSGDYTHAPGSNPWDLDRKMIGYLTSHTNNNSYIRNSTLGGYGYTYTLQNASSGYTPSEISIDTPVGLNNWLSGIVQPSINYHQQYLIPIFFACAKNDTVANSSSSSTVRGSYCGRYKFMGFKGYISLYEC